MTTEQRVFSALSLKRATSFAALTFGFLMCCVPIPAVSVGDDDTCDPGDSVIAESGDTVWCLHEGDSTGHQLAREICLAKIQVGADQAAIRQLGFDSDVEQQAELEKEGKQQYQAFVRQVAGTLFDQTLDAVGVLADSAKSLNPWNVNQSVKALESKWYGGSGLTKALRRIAHVKGKPEIAAAYHDFAELAKTFREGYQTGQAMQEDPESSQLLLLVGVLKTLQGNYELGLVITGVEFAESLEYLSYLGARVDDLTDISDAKLARVSKLSLRLKGHVHDLNESRRKWRQETKIPVDPRCSS